MPEFFLPFPGGKIHIARPNTYRWIKGIKYPVSLCSIATNTSEIINLPTRPDDDAVCKRCLRIEKIRVKNNEM